MNRSTISISVCICTFNRASSLASTLHTLADQKGIDWSSIEIIVVDNNCTDHTRAVVEDLATTVPLRWVVEAKQGLAHARNRALNEASGEWVVFTDDDILLDGGWLSAYLDAFKRFPDAGFAGGQITPHWQDRTPHWFRKQHLEFIDGILGWYEPLDETGYLGATQPTPFGANFGVRRSLVDDLGPFDTELGMRGKKIGRGEETEYFERATKSGFLGIFVAEAHCRHMIDPSRLTLLSFYRYGIAKAHAYRIMIDPKASGSSIAAAAFLFRGIGQLLKGRGDRFRQCIVNAGLQWGLVLSRHGN